MGDVGDYWRNYRASRKWRRNGQPAEVAGVLHKCGGKVTINMGEAAPRLRWCSKCEDGWYPYDDAFHMRGRRLNAEDGR